jgi:hypothetical protein
MLKLCNYIIFECDVIILRTLNTESKEETKREGGKEKGGKRRGERKAVNQSAQI